MNELATDLIVAKDTADKALSITNVCKQDIDNLTTKFNTLHKTNYKTLTKKKRTLQNKVTELQYIRAEGII